MKKSAIDKVIAANEDKIRELIAVNDALRALQHAKRTMTPRPMAAAKKESA